MVEAEVFCEGALRARQQSVEEWLLDYETGSPAPPGTLSKPKNSNLPTINYLEPRPLLRFIGHRTIRKGRLILVFEDINTGEVADLFINVDITIQRGELRGMDRDTGKGGQFLPPEGGSSGNFG